MILRSVDGLDVIFVRVARVDIAFIKFVFESYEGVAIVRTLDRHQAVLSLLISHDFFAVAMQILASLRETVPIEEIAYPSVADDDWLLKWVAQ